ncbi:MAG TPA: histidine phosphatase family protein [Thermoanaerobaculia bacterium]|nr:histidine phosphatase family protein [Thermoanaerobaculia bacterium]
MTRRLLVVRHAIAEDRAEHSGDDAARPLSAKGKRRFKAGARGIVRLTGRIDQVVSSPLVRARETAALLVAACAKTPQRAETDALVPGAHPRELADWLQSEGRPGTVAVVGHEPNLSHLVSWLAASSRRSFVRLKKGSAVLLELPAGPEAGTAVLAWALTPAQLRTLGG